MNYRGTHKITLGLTRKFSIGFTIFSPKLNGFCLEIDVACFFIRFWSRGVKFLKFQNFWNGG